MWVAELITWTIPSHVRPNDLDIEISDLDNGLRINLCDSQEDFATANGIINLQNVFPRLSICR